MKAGSMIGMHKHGIFQGPWSNVKGGKTVEAGFAPRPEVRRHGHDRPGSPHGHLGGRRRHGRDSRLPAGIQQINYIGYYVKGTASVFGPVQRLDRP